MSTTKTVPFQGLKEMLERIQNMGEEPSVDEIVASFGFLEEPLNDHIFVRIDNFHYKGTIIIPDKNKRSPTKGLVVAVAKSVEDAYGIHVGDRVLFSQFAGYLLKFEDTPVCRCLGFSELLSKLRKDAPILSVEGA